MYLNMPDLDISTRLSKMMLEIENKNTDEFLIYLYMFSAF
jgi:hypothetical protein